MTDARETRVAIALGANLGDREGQLGRAIIELRTLLNDVAVSRFHETSPVGVAAPQPDYLNAALTGTTALPPALLLQEMRGIEERLGRTRPYVNAPRTIDLDLILYGDAIVTSETLAVPHPRFREREFVLAPLAEIAPRMTDPVTGMTIESLLARLAAFGSR